MCRFMVFVEGSCFWHLMEIADSTSMSDSGAAKWGAATLLMILQMGVPQNWGAPQLTFKISQVDSSFLQVVVGPINHHV